MVKKSTKDERLELPKVTHKKFDMQAFIALARKVKAITDKEKRDGFLTNEHNNGDTGFSF